MSSRFTNRARWFSSMISQWGLEIRGRLIRTSQRSPLPMVVRPWRTSKERSEPSWVSMISWYPILLPGPVGSTM